MLRGPVFRGHSVYDNQVQSQKSHLYWWLVCNYI